MLRMFCVLDEKKKKKIIVTWCGGGGRLDVVRDVRRCTRRPLLEAVHVGAESEEVEQDDPRLQVDGRLETVEVDRHEAMCLQRRETRPSIWPVHQ